MTKQFVEQPLALPGSAKNHNTVKLRQNSILGPVVSGKVG